MSVKDKMLQDMSHVDKTQICLMQKTKRYKICRMVRIVCVQTTCDKICRKLQIVFVETTCDAYVAWYKSCPCKLLPTKMSHATYRVREDNARQNLSPATNRFCATSSVTCQESCPFRQLATEIRLMIQEIRAYNLQQNPSHGINLVRANKLRQNVEGTESAKEKDFRGKKNHVQGEEIHFQSM